MNMWTWFWRCLTRGHPRRPRPACHPPVLRRLEDVEGYDLQTEERVRPIAARQAELQRSVQRWEQ